MKQSELDTLAEALASEDVTVVTAARPGRWHTARMVVSLIAFAALVAAAAFLVAVAW
jgi:hypothetical protein